MVERTQFHQVWLSLCERFGQDARPNQEMAYYRYLNEQMDTPTCLAAARALWATAKWFPRPADFLLAGAADDWARVLECVRLHHPPEWGWVEPWKRMSERSRAACLALGGIPAMKTCAGNDPIRTKKAWEDAYEQATTSEALALPAPSTTPN